MPSSKEQVSIFRLQVDGNYGLVRPAVGTPGAHIVHSVGRSIAEVPPSAHETDEAKLGRATGSESGLTKSVHGAAGAG
jgi:hypothetical protein